ncbi:MAG TPA: universal stress protein [Acidimicrobiales bacterium]|nr:universal stress protein [Acidimicrobiales bacterium]
MRRILVVANETLTEPHLLDEVRARAAGGDCAVHVVVPASHPTGAWSEGSVRATAAHRLQKGLDALREMGFEATGEVGDVSPVRAIGDALIAADYDEIVLSTLPLGRSRWLKQDVVHRVQRAFPGVRLTHVMATPVATG